MAKKKSTPRLHSSALPSPPKHLSAEAGRWWTSIVREYSINDESGLLMLRAALECFDRSNAARELLKKEGLVTVNKYGESRPHPAVGIETNAKKGMLSYLRALNLDVEPLHKGPGRPPGK